MFTVALPALMFRLMCGLSKLPPVDARLLIAFFGGCLIVFVIGRLVGWKLFGLDGVSQSVFALGGVFSNNLMLGLPLAKIVLGDASVPSVAMVLVFNSLTALDTGDGVGGMGTSWQSFRAWFLPYAAERADQSVDSGHHFRILDRAFRLDSAGIR